MTLTLPSMLFLRSLYNTRTWSQNWSNSGMTKSFRNTFTIKGKFNSITDLNWSKVRVMLSKEAEVLGLNLLSWLIMALNLGSVLGRIPVLSISYFSKKKFSHQTLIIFLILTLENLCTVWIYSSIYLPQGTCGLKLCYLHSCRGQIALPRIWHYNEIKI